LIVVFCFGGAVEAAALSNNDARIVDIFGSAMDDMTSPAAPPTQNKIQGVSGGV
jgi:hypothetical protein